MLPYEQKTQQSPGFGRSTVAQDGHLKKNRQASVGISAPEDLPQLGHTMIPEVAMGSRMNDFRLTYQG